jgi:hypothetical protein
MPGVIEQLAAETSSRQLQEAEHDAERAAERVVEDERRRRRRFAAARKRAMQVGEQLTGRVIFPARWSAEDSERSTVICIERIEGRVELAVEVAVADYGGNDLKVEARAVVVRRVTDDETARAVSWKNPGGPLSPGGGGGPISPGRDWFRRALIELGVIA